MMKKFKTFAITALGSIVVYEAMRKSGLLDRIAGEMKLRIGTMNDDPMQKLDGMIDKGKGHIKEGYDADFVFINPNSSYTLEAEDLEYRNKISPYIGREIGAQVVRTILRGNTVYAQEEGVSEEYVGEFIIK